MTDRGEGKHKKLLLRVVNGAIAGVVGTSLVYPLDFAKTRMQSQTNAYRDALEIRPYKNIFDVISKTSKTNGVFSVYKGLGVNLAFVMPEKAIKLAVNDHVRSSMGSKAGSFLTLKQELIAGCAAGICQVVVTTPMELLKIQMQMENSVHNNPRQSAIKIGYQMVKSNGVWALYRGFKSTLLRDVCFSAIYFPLFAFLNSKGVGSNNSPPRFYHTLSSGFIAGSVAAFAVTPLDVIKTRIQFVSNDPNRIKYNGILDCIVKTVKDDSMTAFFKGASARVMVIAPLFAIAQTVYFLGVAEKLLKLTNF